MRGVITPFSIRSRLRPLPIQDTTEYLQQVSNLKELLPNSKLLEIWLRHNKTVFDNQLKPCWLTPVDTTAYGKAIGQWLPDQRTIQIVEYEIHRAESVILHEAAHQYVSEVLPKEGLPSTWSRDFGRGPRTGRWSTANCDPVHDTPEWLHVIKLVLSKLGVTDLEPFAYKVVNGDKAPCVYDTEARHFTVLKPGTTTHEGRRLVHAKYFPLWRP